MASDSSSSSKASSSAAYQPDVDTWRDSIVRDAGPKVPELPLVTFFNHLLPPLSSSLQNSFDGICRELRQPESDDTSPAYTGGVWTAWPTQKKLSKPEEQTFAALVNIAHAIRAAVTSVVPGHSDPSLDFANDPNNAPWSGLETVKTRPDGYFIRRSRDSPTSPHWMDIVATGEYKYKAGNKQETDNVAKALWNMHHTLRDDPRRRFAYAFTIEQRTMRIWYANRAEVYVSEPFNVDLDMKHLVHFFLSLSYADEHLLGWDPTMRMVRAPVTNKIQYVIAMRTPTTRNSARFRTEYYLTDKIISDFGPTSLRGRGTRVWEVKRCTKDGQLFRRQSGARVLKDCWIDSDREREGDILSRVLEDAKKLGKYDELKALLLTVKCHGDVCVDEDTKDETPLRGPLDIPPKDQWFDLVQVSERAAQQAETKRQTQESEVHGGHQSVYDFVESAQSPTLYHSKVHYRIVFEEVCVVLREVRLLDQVLRVLKGACDALKVLHAVGWLHRDVSIGNILIKSSGSVVLADLEYAKRFDDRSLHKVRTGTPAFMAVEAQFKGYLFDEATYISSLNVSSITEAVKQLRDPISTPFRLNPLHDLESLFWIMVYCTVNKDIYPVLKSDIDRNVSLRAARECQEDPDERRIRLRIQRSHAMSVFSGLGAGRTGVLTVGRALPIMYSSLHAVLRICRLDYYAHALRDQLVGRYRKVEREPSKIKQDCAGSLYNKMANVFSEAANTLQGLQILVGIRPLTQAELYSRHPSLSTLSSIQSDVDFLRTTQSDTVYVPPPPEASPRKRKRTLHDPLPQLPRRAGHSKGGLYVGVPPTDLLRTADRPTKIPRLSQDSLRRSPRFSEAKFAVPSIPPFRPASATRSIASSSAQPKAGPSNSGGSGSKRRNEQGRRR